MCTKCLYQIFGLCYENIAERIFSRSKKNKHWIYNVNKLKNISEFSLKAKIKIVGAAAAAAVAS